MAKLDLNCTEFEGEAAALTPIDSVTNSASLVPNELLPPAPLGRDYLAPIHPSAPVPAAGGPGPMVIVALIDHALTAVSEISRCVANVAMEKQRTKQIRAQAEVQIEASRQQTRQVQIQQKEETRRFAAQCKTELESKEIELKKLRANLQFENAQRLDRHQTYMAALNGLEQAISVLISQSDALCKELQKTDAEGKQSILQSMDKVGSDLVMISSEIVKLRQG